MPYVLWQPRGAVHGGQSNDSNNYRRHGPDGGVDHSTGGPSGDRRRRGAIHRRLDVSRCRARTALATFDLTIKVEKEKVVGEIKNPELPAQAITDITKVEKSLVLRYSFDYQGNPVDAAVSLTPAEGGKTNAEIDFAGGAYVMSGTATKKEKAK